MGSTTSASCTGTVAGWRRTTAKRFGGSDARLGRTTSTQYNLGWMYETGRGVERDRVEAVRWYRLAAEQGDADAREALDRLR